MLKFQRNEGKTTPQLQPPTDILFLLDLLVVDVLIHPRSTVPPEAVKERLTGLLRDTVTQYKNGNGNQALLTTFLLFPLSFHLFFSFVAACVVLVCDPGVAVMKLWLLSI